MIYYVADPTSSRALDACENHGFGALLGPHRLTVPRLRLALDNGAWKCRENPESWTETFEARFYDRLSNIGSKVDFAVAPDLVCRPESIAFTMSHLGRVLNMTHVALIAVQNGMIPSQVSGMLSKRVGIAIGGSTEWKEETCYTWARLCRTYGAWCHMLRANTTRRLGLARAAGCTSADGSSVAMFADTAPLIAKALRTPAQVDLCRLSRVERD